MLNASVVSAFQEPRSSDDNWADFDSNAMADFATPDGLTVSAAPSERRPDPLGLFTTAADSPSSQVIFEHFRFCEVEMEKLGSIVSVSIKWIVLAPR